MRFGLDVPTTGVFADPRLLADLAVEAEQAGWEGFFIWDLLLGVSEPDQAEPVADPWVALTAVALATTRIRIGALMTPLPRRRPWQVARTVSTLDRLSGGRVIFGAGLGYQPREYQAIGEDPDARKRASKLEEGLTIVDRIWRGEPVTINGEHYRLDLPRLLPRPVQTPRVPIWLAAGWPRRRPVRRAAHWDGVYLMTVNQETGQLLEPEDLREVAEFVKLHRPDRPRFDIAVNPKPSASTDRAGQARAYQEAGATWWVELPPADDESAGDYRQRIRQGPPR